jgi:hypothetical protein
VHKPQHGREAALVKLRQGLVALKQFEHCYVLARWIRILWIDIFDRSDHKTKSKQFVSSERISPSNAQVLSQQHQVIDTISDVSQVSDMNYVSDGWQETTPFSLGSWSSMFVYDDHTLNFDFPLPNNLEYHGLQFLANLGSIRFGQHNV